MNTTTREEMIHSFADRLTRRIIAIVLVAMSMIAVVAYYLVKNRMADEAEERYHGIMYQTHEQIQRMLSDVNVAINSNLHDVERDIQYPERMFEHVQRIITQNKDFLACSMLFEAGYYPQKGRWFGAYARRDSLGTITTSQIGSEHFDYISTNWYIKAMNKDEGDWMEPYFDENYTRQLQTTYAVHLHDRTGQKVGLMTADLSLEWLRKRMRKTDLAINRKFEIDSRFKSYSFIIDHHGTFIIHPDEQYMLKDSLPNHVTDIEKSSSVIRKMLSGQNGSGLLEIDGVPTHVFYHNIKFIDFTIVIAVPQSVIYHNGRILNMIILVTILLALAATYLICRNTIRRASRPLTDYAAKAASVEKELLIAHDIQMAMLPKSSFTDSNDVDISASLTPAHDIGGDLYDFFLRNDQLFFCIGDVSGKGVPAALVMAMIRNAFRMQADHVSEPNNIIIRMNEAIARENEYNIFITFFVGVLDLPTGHLSYCNAGHKAPVIIEGKEGKEEQNQQSGRSSSLFFLPIDSNLPLGAMPGWEYEIQETMLAPGTTIFLYTDGLTEAEDAKHKQFGSEQMMKTIEALLLSPQSDSFLKSLIENMSRAVEYFVNGTVQSDDLTMLAIQYTRDHDIRLQETITLPCDINETPRIAEFVERVCQTCGLSPNDTFQLNLALEEAVVNVMNYAYEPDSGGEVTIEAIVNKEWLKLIVIDKGKPFDPTQKPHADITLSAEEREIGGLGIHLMRRFTDDLHYERCDDKNILTLKKKL